GCPAARPRQLFHRQGCGSLRRVDPRNAGRSSPRADRMKWLRLAIRAAIGFLTTLGALACLVTATPLVEWWAKPLSHPWDDQPGDVLVVLGGSVVSSGMIGESSYWRTVYGVWAWRAGGFQKIVLSGETAIVEPMHRFMINEGVPDSVFLIE